MACTGFRNPAILAKMADTLDEVSDGRVVLGLGAGWHEPEYHAFGIPYDHRVGRFEEALAIIVPLLREGRVDFQGQYYQARDCVLAPRGPRPGGPPILIGAQRPGCWRSPPATPIATTPTTISSPATWQPVRGPDRACAEVGRDPATISRAPPAPGWRSWRPGEPRPGLPGATLRPGAAAFELGGMRQMARVGTSAELLEHARTFSGGRRPAPDPEPGPSAGAEEASRCSPRSSRASAGRVNRRAVAPRRSAGHAELPCRGGWPRWPSPPNCEFLVSWGYTTIKALEP